MRSFRDFMESALYDPERGYYSVREKAADFYTAPELHPAFGTVLADRLAVLLLRVAANQTDRTLSIVEAGCGDGTLACQVARRLREKHADLASRVSFILVERGRKDLTTAIRRLTAFGVKVSAYTDIAKIPPFCGVLYSNELLDALPVHLLQSDGGTIREVFVDDLGAEVLGALSRPELTAHASKLKDLGDGERHAVGLEARAWIAAAAAKVEDGFIVSIDYGKRFAPGAPNPPRSFRKHAVETELTRDPGARDLTASVDFESVISAGDSAGLGLESFDSLSKFLIEGGLLSHLEAAAGDDSGSYRERAKLKTLIHPEGMGEVFKVLIQRKAK